MDNNGKIVERLRRHYDDVPELAHTPNPGFEKIVEQLEAGPETFRKVVVEGLNGIKGGSRPARRRRQYGKIRRSDLDDSKLVEADHVLSYVAIKVPTKILKKLKVAGAREGTAGAVFYKSHFKANSPFSDSVEHLVLLTGESKTHLEHEKSHVRYHKHNHAENDTLTSLENELAGEKKRTECVRLMALRREHYVLDEILARGLSEKNEVFMDDTEKKFYAGYLAKSFVETVDRHGLYDLPDVDRPVLNALVRDELTSSYKEMFDAGIRAFNSLYRDLPEKTVERIVFSCGSNDCEKGFGPVQELVFWSKHYKEVLGAGQGGK